jgi:mannose-6-phosphate isomerase-like protein (cupin superfamily)
MIFTGQVERWRNVYAPNPAMLQLLLIRQGYEPYRWSERLGAFYSWHFHDEEQIHWVIEGQLEITFQDFGKTFSYILKAGDRDFMPPKMYHTARVVGDRDLLYFVGIKKKVEEPKEIEKAAEPPIVVAAEPKAKKPRAKAAAKPKTAKPKTAAKTKKKK